MRRCTISWWPWRRVAKQKGEANHSDDPIRIHCDSLEEIPSTVELVAKSESGRHVVLEFSALNLDEQSMLTSALSAALPDHSVFFSGGTRTSPKITVMPVVSRKRVLERLDEVRGAIANYRVTCASLMARYKSGALSPEWSAYEHGAHCCFTNRRSGQEVEAPLRGEEDSKSLDPYFFARFVRTTGAHEAVADLIRHDFHDAARILEVAINIDDDTKEV